MSVLTLSQNMEDVRLLRYVWIRPWSSLYQRFFLGPSAITYSGYTLLVWGYLLTLDDEVGYLHPYTTHDHSYF